MVTSFFKHLSDDKPNPWSMSTWPTHSPSYFYLTKAYDQLNSVKQKCHSFKSWNDRNATQIISKTKIKKQSKQSGAYKVCFHVSYGISCGNTNHGNGATSTFIYSSASAANKECLSQTRWNTVVSYKYLTFCPLFFAKLSLFCFPFNFFSF